MLGLMQDAPLTVGGILRRAETFNADKEVVTARPGDAPARVTYGALAERARRVAGALDDLGVPESGRVGTFGWNTQRHLELYLGVPLAGRVVHTINVRLFGDQIRFIVAHAEDDVVFVDRSLVPTLLDAIGADPVPRHVIVMDDGDEPLPDDPRGVATRDYKRKRKK